MLQDFYSSISNIGSYNINFNRLMYINFIASVSDNLCVLTYNVLLISPLTLRYHVLELTKFTKKD